jgi:hypothetical protein
LLSLEPSWGEYGFATLLAVALFSNVFLTLANVELCILHDLPSLSKVILDPATPFHNTVKDPLGLLHPMWFGARSELHNYIGAIPDRAPLLSAWKQRSQLYEELDKLDATDPLSSHLGRVKVDACAGEDHDPTWRGN